MKEIVMFECADGERFTTKALATKHEVTVKIVSELKAMLLPIKLDTIDFTNGSGFIQLTSRQIAEFKVELTKALKKYHGAAIVESTSLGRMLNDTNSPFDTVYRLTYQIDSMNRLWGQPYYALHPNEGK